ncbi:hypothetical protein C8R45DRAFT_1112306 [Mycena sanguinolenta]|nr:hypothetical protein C8R45DRAFT_1112306 [Mycena sanguinolenta]
MRFISVFHVLSAVALATVAAPVVDKSISAVSARDDLQTSPDVIQPIDISSSGHGNVEEVDPDEPDTGCVIA